jgi:hypothetical protein
MKASTILNALSAVITPPLVAARAHVSMAQDETEALNQLEGDVLGDFRVILSIDSERIVESNDADGIVESTIAAYVQGHVSLDLLPGRSVSGATVSTPDSFLDRIQYVIALVRGADISDEPNIDCSVGRIFRFQTWTWLRIAELPAYRAAKCEFVIRYALDDPAAVRLTDAGEARLTDAGAPREH